MPGQASVHRSNQTRMRETQNGYNFFLRIEMGFSSKLTKTQKIFCLLRIGEKNELNKKNIQIHHTLTRQQRIRETETEKEKRSNHSGERERDGLFLWLLIINWRQMDFFRYLPLALLVWVGHVLVEFHSHLILDLNSQIFPIVWRGWDWKLQKKFQ